MQENSYNADCEERSYGDPHLDDDELQSKFVDAFNACQCHAASCHECFMPIIDDEGNPGYMTEACSAGAALLANYNRLEKLMFALLARLRSEGKYV